MPYIPYPFSTTIEHESNDNLLNILKSLNKKLRLDNVDECSFAGMASTVINIDIVSRELRKRQLSKKEENRLVKVTSEYQLALLSFEDWCSCKSSKDYEELIEFAKEVTAHPWDCVKCLESFEKTKEILKPRR